MQYRVLACDYDGTIATDGHLDEPTLAALRRVRESGRKLLLVTGRELADLKSTCPHLEVFDLIVGENGALLYEPATERLQLLATPPPAAFTQLLQQRGVRPLSIGHVIVATWQPHEHTVLATIRDLGLELQVIFNKGAVMVLPAGVNKASGLQLALKDLGLTLQDVVGIGDAENDHAFLGICRCSVAVANALPTLKARVDIVTRGDHGAGAAELIEDLVADDLRGYEARLRRKEGGAGIEFASN